MFVEHFHSGKSNYATSLSCYDAILGTEPRSGGCLLSVPTGAGRDARSPGWLHVGDITPRQSPAAQLGFCIMCPLTPWAIAQSHPLTAKEVANYACETRGRISRADGTGVAF